MTTKLAEIRAAVAAFHPNLEDLPEWEAQIYVTKFAVVSCIWLTDLLDIAEAAEAVYQLNHSNVTDPDELLKWSKLEGALAKVKKGSATERERQGKDGEAI